MSDEKQLKALKSRLHEGLATEVKRWSPKTHASISEDATDYARSTVSRLALDGEDIKFLLEVVFARVSALSHMAGVEAGRVHEREVNPAMRSVGEAVNASIAGQLAAQRATLIAVFDAEQNRGSNPHAAFNQALKAITPVSK